MLVAISVIYVGIAFVELVATSRAIAPFENIVGSASALLGSRSMGVALHLLKTLFLPFLLAVYISLGLSSFVGLLVQRLRLPTTAAVGITLLITLVVFWLVGLLLVTSVEHDGERQSTQPIRIGGVGDGQRADRTLAIVADGRTIAGSNARAWPARDSIRGPTPFRRRGFTGPILRAVQGETMRFKATLGTMLLAAATLAGAANEKLMIDGFSAGDLKSWQTKSFKGETRYTFNGKGGRRALFADSQGGASGLYRKIPVDLNRTPWLNWSWRVDKVLTGVDERSKTGDDYPARVYVLVSGGAAFLEL